LTNERVGCTGLGWSWDFSTGYPQHRTTTTTITAFDDTHTPPKYPPQMASPASPVALRLIFSQAKPHIYSTATTLTTGSFHNLSSPSSNSTHNGLIETVKNTTLERVHILHSLVPHTKEKEREAPVPRRERPNKRERNKKG
jgi:hypothetical protein